MHKVQRRHLNYVQRKPYYRDYSIRSVKGYSGTAEIVHPGSFDFGYTWDYTFPEAYSEDSVLFAKIFTLSEPIVNGSPVTGAVSRVPMTLENLTNTGFVAKSTFAWSVLLQTNGGGNVSGVINVPRGADYSLFYAVFDPSIYTINAYAVVYEIDPESYSDLSA